MASDLGKMGRFPLLTNTHFDIRRFVQAPLAQLLARQLVTNPVDLVDFLEPIWYDLSRCK